MRLICPNCGAQYAVADGVIPSGGRDVQCSNCAHTWFETPGASSEDMMPAPRKVVRPATPPTDVPTDRFSGSIDDAFKDVDEPTVAPAPQPPADRKPLDQSVADILREEAALEAAQRRSEVSAPMESQSDLGLSDPAPKPAPKQPAEPAPTPDPSQIAAPAAAAVASASASRKELLPDIEEINSSLRSDAERSEAGEMPDDQSGKKRKGFRSGFVTVLLIILAFVLVYIFADQIAAAIPDLAGPLATYVETDDVWRIWLDDNVQAMLRSIAAE